MFELSPMALILVVQSELWDRLRLQSFAVIRQRIDFSIESAIMIALKPRLILSPTYIMRVPIVRCFQRRLLKKSIVFPAAQLVSSIKFERTVCCTGLKMVTPSLTTTWLNELLKVNFHESSFRNDL